MSRPVLADLLLTGGHVIDAGGGHVGRYDVAVRAGRIAAVEPALPADGARQVVDVRGKVVTPGLIDLHTHVATQATYWGIDPDPVAWCSGVTTWVDAGSAGAYSLDAFRVALRRLQVRVPVLLNISALGLTGRTGECRDLHNCDVDLAVAAVRDNRDLVAGIKVRIDRETVGGNGVEPLRRGIMAAEACDVPVMVHVGTSPPAVADVVALLRPGDIVTHCASAIAAGPELVSPAMRDAYARGVLFDLGHGSGGFAFDVLEAQLESGLTPHTVSSDLHARCLYGPVFDLPTTMAKLLAVGLPLEEVVAAATIRPARALNLPGGAGTLSPGAPADLAVFSVAEGPFELVDAHGQRRVGKQRLVNEATYLGGRLLPPRLPEPPRPWIPLTTAQRHALDDRADVLRALFSTPLVGPDGLSEQFPRRPEESPGTDERG
ncbi:amidohydrolase/deacetylase family metallohydrolase [Micromonospora sp. C28SCA-DRY-2]|uniref:amidohydrolase/deacetylase family metallohydrolase n=1 Tax=Micromonospora sp. C28SCA-DRY-2 TaxID=3059522 RepID=UPI0026751665|nr:amidohydrolase/deacetylase family metallohydrolase [Micromonospora sp. C28SCA-DRY-2]MDO3703256.1 amidohydrolase/deacetylase family metallohydrolase [Micromonospora sp. C28SCA-DRY-2]